MASIGDEDLRKGASKPALVVQARSAIVRSFNNHASFAYVERKRHHSLALVDPVPRPNVKVVHERPHHFSGISSQRASPSVPAGIAHTQSTGALPSSSSCRDTRVHSAISRSSVHISDPTAVCQSSCHLEPVIHGYQSHRHLNPLRLRSRLLGKRAFTPPLSIYSHCPSPPKTSLHKASVIVEKSMPVNQSYPWSRSKLRSNSIGVYRSSTAKLSTVARIETKELKKSCDLIYGKSESKKDIKKHSQTTVPLEDKYTDVPPNHILDLSEYDKIVAVDSKENEHIVECCVAHGDSEAPQRVRKVSSEVEFTAAVRKLTKNMGSGSPNGLSGPATANFNSQCKNREVKAGANSAIQASAVCLINGSEEFHMDTHPSSTRCLDENSPCVQMTQDSICAIPDNIDHRTDSNQSPTVYSVMNKISAIQITKDCCWQTSEEDSSQCSMTVDEERLPDTRGQVNVLQDGEEKELPEELQNVCSGSNDDGSESDTSSAPSVVSSSNVEESMSCELEVDQVVKPALVPSLFPFRPPTLYFSAANEQVELLPVEQRSLLKWKLSSVTPNVVKNTITRSHFKITKNSHDWLGCWGHHMKSPGFKAIREYQKLNHFPGTFQIGRKDRLWRNLSKMQKRFGKQEFGFFPRSFVLPQDMKPLRKAWEDGGSRQKWIIKPPASARGIGIQVIHKWSQMPHKRPLLVQKYLHKPYLISGNKFDLRIYVYVTSYDPLRVYIFNDGLVRFASCKYSSSMKSLSNKFMHLTNYSVNKNNSEYQTNSDDKACQGHKWALKALWHYLESKGINTTLIWETIKDMVIKTIIASDSYVNTLLKMNLRSAYSCHELFGFDIMLDESLKPWVLEVNISPSLHSNSALDLSIKGQMIQDVLNLAGFVLPKKEEIILSSSSSCSSTSSLNEGAWEKSRSDLSTDEKMKRAFYLTQNFGDQDFCSTILEVLTPNDVNILAESEDELSRLGDFERIFPSPTTSSYLRFFEQPRYLNLLLNQWEQKYSQNRSKGIILLKSLCQKKVHLGNFADSTHNWSSKSKHRHCADRQSTSLAKTVFTKSCARLSRCVSSQLDEEDDDEWTDHDVQAVTASVPDMYGGIIDPKLTCGQQQTASPGLPVR